MMKAHFENIGPIKNAELELGDLTIIAGQNNTGKTYLVYTLYGFLDMVKAWDSFFFEFDEAEISLLDDPNRLVNEILESGKSFISLDEYIKVRTRIMQKLSETFSSNEIKEIFRTYADEFENAVFNLEIENTAMNYATNYVTTRITSKSEGSTMSMRFVPDDKTMIFELINTSEIKVTRDQVKRGMETLLWKMTPQEFPVPFILSAERFGISLFYRELDFTKNRLVEELQKLPERKQIDPFALVDRASARYAKPISDNIDFTRDIHTIRLQKSKLLQSEHTIKAIENMMGAYYKYQGNEIRLVSKTRGANKFSIPLHLASSSARGLSDLYFYLKHVVDAGQLLIIDEPESHLSPTNQILIARFLVLCVNAGLKVLITTHSDYIIKEVNNLIMLSNDFDEKEAFLEKNKEYSEDDCLRPEKVKAYTCKKKGILEECTIDKMGIDMPVFDKAIDKINEISNELILSIDEEK